VKVQELADLINAKVVTPPGMNPAAIDVHGVAPLDQATKTDLSFLTNPAFEKFMTSTQAAAVVVKSEAFNCPAIQLIHANPYWGFAKCAQVLLPRPTAKSGISPQAFVSPSATVDPTASVMPFAYVGDGTRIGAGAVIYPGVYIGPGAVIGEHAEIRANAVIEFGCKIGPKTLIHAGAVIGADGFGFAPGADGIAKIPQVGTVEIGSDVEIGSGTTIDRAAMGVTRIGDGTKLDSAVHVGHNVEIGKHSMLCGQVGIAGSAKIGNRVILAGHSGVNNGVEIGDNIQVGAMAGVTKSLKEPGQYMGFPAEDAGDWRRVQASLRRLPDLVKRVRDLEEKLEGISK